MASRDGSRPACRRVSGRLVLAVGVAVCLTFAAEAVACPNCKDAFATADTEGMNLARGYFYSILIMLAMPCLLVGSFGLYVWREMRRQKLAPPDRPAAAGDLGPFRASAATPQP